MEFLQHCFKLQCTTEAVFLTLGQSPHFEKSGFLGQTNLDKLSVHNNIEQNTYFAKLPSAKWLFFGLIVNFIFQKLKREQLVFLSFLKLCPISRILIFRKNQTNFDPPFKKLCNKTENNTVVCKIV